MSTICATIRGILEPLTPGLTVSDVRIGLGYTAVRLDNDSTGVAYTFHGDSRTDCSHSLRRRPVVGLPASEALSFMDSSGLLDVTVGLATANALANTHQVTGSKGDVLEAIELTATDHVGMVGFFGPLLGPLQEKVARVTVFDDRRFDGTTILEPDAAFTVLPQCQVAVITSTTIINGSLEPLLDAAAHCREVILLGSSTVLLPQAFTGTCVTCLSGIVIDDPDGLLQVVSEAGGTRLFKPFVSKRNVPLGGMA